MTEKVVSAIMSGMEVALMIIQTLMGKARNADLTDADIQRLSTSEGDKLIDRFVEMMVKAFHPKPAQMTFKGKYNVLVDYARSIEELVDDNNTSFVSLEVCSENFPPIRTGRELRKIFIVNFGEVLDTTEVINKLKEQGLRPVDAQELLTLGHQEEADVYDAGLKVAALGQLTDRIVRDDLSCIIMDCSYEFLKLLRIQFFANDHAWDADTVFAALWEDAD